MLKDPVCGMAVAASSLHQGPHEGKPVCFCSAGCKAKFTANPSQYLPAGSAAQLATAEVSAPVAKPAPTRYASGHPTLNCPIATARIVST